VSGWVAIASLLAAVAVQAGVGGVWPAAHRYVDALLVPVVWCGVAGSQRSAMIAGCTAGLLQDAWFQVGLFGINGLKKTLVGWVLGTVATLLDMNHLVGRLLAGALAAIGDSLLDLLIRRFLDQVTPVPTVPELLAKAAICGLLVAGLGRFAERRAQLVRS
jgi:rod shape-determining protein MreD